MTLAMSIIAAATAFTVVLLVLMLTRRIPINRFFIFFIVFNLPFLGAGLMGDHALIIPVNICLADIFLLPAVIYLLLKKLRLKAQIELPFLWLFCLFFLWMMVSLYAGIYKYSLEVSVVSIIVTAIKFCILIIYFYVVVNLVRDADDLSVFVMAWMLSGAISALLGIVGALLYQIFGISTIFASFFRAQGTFGNANMYAVHMIMNFFIAFVYFKMGGKKWIFISLLLIYIVGLIMSSSKGGMLAFLVAFTAFATIVPQYRFRSFAIIGSLLLVFSGYSLMSNTSDDTGGIINLTRLAQVTDTESSSTQSRLFLWGSSLEVWKDNLLLGVGRGLFGKVSLVKEKMRQQAQNETQSRHFQEEEESDYIVSHSTYISLLCETGIIGLLLFISIMATFFHRVVRSLISLDSSSNSYIIMACLGAALTGILVHGVVSNVENFRSLWCLAGLICVVSDWTVSNKMIGSPFKIS